MRHNPQHLYYQSLEYRCLKCKSCWWASKSTPAVQWFKMAESRRRTAVNGSWQLYFCYIQAAAGSWLSVFNPAHKRHLNRHLSNTYTKKSSGVGGQYAKEFKGPNSVQFHYFVHSIGKLMSSFFRFELNQCPKPGWEIEYLPLPGANTQYVGL